MARYISITLLIYKPIQYLSTIFYYPGVNVEHERQKRQRITAGQHWKSSTRQHPTYLFDDTIMHYFITMLSIRVSNNQDSFRVRTYKIY